MASLADFFVALGNPLMQRALITAVIIGIIGSVIGVFVLLKGMIFLGEAIAHSAFAGAALGILLGIDPLITILIFGVTSAVGIGYVNEKKVMKDDVIIGVVFTFFMALAILFIGLMPSYSTDIFSILFGNILFISIENFIILICLSVVILVIVFGLKKEFYLITFNSEMAKIAGIPVKFLNYLFLILIAVTIDISLKAIGAILVFAMIVTPAAAAYQWTFKINKMFILSITFGVFSALFGLLFSFLWDLPSGSTIVSLTTLIFAVSFILSPKRRKTGIIPEECGFCSQTIAGKTYCLDENCTHLDIPHKHDDEGLIIYKTDLKPKKEKTIHKHTSKGEDS